MNTNADEIFNEALKLENQDARLGYVRGACQGNPELQKKIERLLAAHENAADLIATEPGQEPFFQTVSEEAGTIIGRYKLLQKIGEGGMGAVFMAEQTEPVRRKVALKIIKLGMDTKSVVARFEAERQALALMDHPNIAKVLDAGATETGRPYFVMELVKGVPISTYCDKNHLPTRQRLELFNQVCQSIQHAHQKGVIHRDIKPSNILVTLHDGKPVPKVIDFGIAKATNQRLTEKTLFTNFAQMIGTPAYMSPEQAEMSGLDIDTRTDVYSLGVLLYELLTGTTPFPEKELLSKGYGEMQRIIAEQEPDRPSLRMSTLVGEQQTFVTKNRAGDLPQLTKQLRGDLDWIVMKALEKDRTQRYGSPNELAADLSRHLKNEPVTAAAPSLLYPFQKFYRRHRKAVLAAVLVTGGLYIAGAVAAYQAVRAKNAEQQANLARDAEIRVSKLHQEERNRALIAEAQARQGEIEAKQLAESRRIRGYVGDMISAQAAIKDDNYALARKLLLRHKDPTDGDDLRAFEWRYLWESCRDRSIESTKLDRRGNAAYAGLTFDPTQQWLACHFLSHLEKHTVDLLSYPSLTFAHRIDLDPSVALISADFSLDGKYLLLSLNHRADRTLENGEIANVITLTLQIYRTGSWELIQEAKDIHWLTLFLGNNQIATSTMSYYKGEDNKVKLRRTPVVGRLGERGWETLYEIEPLPFLRPPGITCNYESGIVAAPFQHQFGQVGLWRYEDGRQPELIRKLPGAPRFALSKNGKLCATFLTPDPTKETQNTVLYETHTGAEIPLEEPYAGLAPKIRFNEDATLLVTGGFDYRLRVWSTEDGSYIGEIQGHPGEIWDFVISNHIATCLYKDGQIKNWDLRLAGQSQTEWKQIPLLTPTPRRSQQIEQPTQQALMHQLHPDVIQLFESNTIPWRLPSKLRDNSAASATSGERLSSISPDGRYLEVHTPDKKIVRYLDLELDGIVVMEGERLPRERRLFVSSSHVLVGTKEHLELWTLPTQNRQLLSTSPGPEVSILSHYYVGRPSWVFDDQLLLPLANSHGCIWDLASNEATVQMEYPDQLRQVHFSPDRKKILLAGYHPDLHLFNASTGELTLRLQGHKNGCNGDFSPDGRTLFSMSHHAEGRLWNLETGLEMVKVEGSQIKSPWCFPAFTLDGNGLYAWEEDRDGEIDGGEIEGMLRILTLPTLEEIDAQIEKDLTLRR